MKNKNIPTNTELPSMGKLLKSTILAIIMASVILVTVVLPAEYGIDPTGIGDAIGLLKMGEIKVSLAEEAAAEKVSDKIPVSNSTNDASSETEAPSEQVPSQAISNIRIDEITFSLAPNEGKEIKLVMAKGEQVDYVWWTDGGKANFDTHADSKELQIKYHGYGKGSLERSEGMLEAAFDGQHGWFWRNRTSQPMNVTLQINGEYSEIKRMY